MTRPSLWSRTLARLVRASLLVDRGYIVFDRVRSRLVLGLAPDGFFDAYNLLAYEGDPPEAETSPELFDWERDAVDRMFPAPPARVLVGGAGRGREALALARLGYIVTAFDPVRPLIEAVASSGTGGTSIEGLVGRYEELPRLETTGPPRREVDLAARAPFDAAIVGWGSLSHLRTTTDRVAALTGLARLTPGPILVSYVPETGQTSPGEARRGAFSPRIGFYRRLTAADLRDSAAAAGLEVIRLDHNTTHPYAVLRLPPAAALPPGQIEATSPAAPR